MSNLSWCDPYVAAVERSWVSAVETLFGETGRPARPQMHIFMDRPEPYVGFVTCRPIHSSETPEGAYLDAYLAISGMEVAADALGAARLLFAWEDADMRTSLSGPGNYAPALVTVDASATNHTLTWRSFTPRLISGAAGTQSSSIQLDWGPVQQLHDVDLMSEPNNPIGMALWNWRRGVRLDLDVLDDMQLDGYEFHWRTDEFIYRPHRPHDHGCDVEPGSVTMRPIYFDDF